MKKTFLLAVLVTLGSASLFAQTGKSPKPASAQASMMYTCSMHPEVKSDKPGKCPKCGMTLDKMEKKQESAPVRKTKPMPKKDSLAAKPTPGA